MKASTSVRTATRHEQGQILIIVGLGMVAIIAMVGLVIDVGLGWAHQRDAQNGSDAAANAGAIVLLKKLAGETRPNWDSDVDLAVQAAADENGISVPRAEYTRWDGTPTNALVGGGSVPPGAQGVAVTGRKTFDTFFAQVIGISQMTANAEATAVAGNVDRPCATTDGCPLLPIALPATMVTCANNGQDSVPAVDANGYPKPWPDSTQVTIPLCGDNPGSVAWIDWTAQSQTAGCAGTGTAEIICHVLNPPVADIATPSWQSITATGGIPSAALEDALNTYRGQIVLLPLFDSTCNKTPSNPTLDGCKPANVGGNGSDQWYHIPEAGFLAFRLDYPKGAYTDGSNGAACDKGNGATACLTGTSVTYVGGGTVGPVNGGKYWGIQLIH